MAEWTLKTNPDDSSTLPPEPPQPPGPGHSRKPATEGHFWVWVIVLVLAAAAVFFLYHQYQAAEEAKKSKDNANERGVPVTVGAAKKGDIGVYVEALGTVTPVYTVTVTSRVQGQIMNVFYREGQTVRKGDPLLDIDPRPYQAAVTQTEGQLAHDEAVLAEAKIDLDRYQAAFNQNAIAQQQVYDQQQTVKQDEGTVKNDQGLVDTAKVNLVYCHITSPIDGRVGLRLVDPGNIVQANSTTALVVVTQLQPITVIFSVAEDYLAQIQQQLSHGQKMKVDALDRDQSKTIATGSLLTLDNQVDTTTGTVKLRAIFQNKDNALFPNQFVNAKLLVETQHGVVLVPTQAIQRNSQQAFVYVIKPDETGSGQTASVQNITVGATDGNTAAVQGVQAGQVIALSGFDKLQDGIKVEERKGKNANSSGNSASSEDQAP
ncbi:MAG TPA: efflux RND transporter periplasmic adaptor subunit [Candidatus Baltobacteraceae bacterium]|nr:efflux RND transporter periplasmic adaptor subunit [Candidatus Baltobacteraceae bacterium]